MTHTEVQNAERRLPNKAEERRGLSWSLHFYPMHSAFCTSAKEAALVLGTLALTALIALLDYETGPDLSFGPFYLLPVMICAWWAGLPHGMLLALAGAISSYGVALLEHPTIPVTVAGWNAIVLFGTLALLCSLIARLRAGLLREQRLARTDPLTGAANARTFYEAAEAERARRERRPLTLAYFDLDNFKRLNDDLGHVAGDSALIQVVNTIRGNLRHADLLARLGGDEFALLLPGMEGAAASDLLLRLQAALAREMARRGWPVTLSVGAITFARPTWEVDVMIQHADALMYMAKRSGQGRIQHEVIREDRDPRMRPWPHQERRATARILVDRTCTVSCTVQTTRTEEGTGEEFATVHDISAAGAGLHMDKRLATGTVVVIEPMMPGARTLLARIVRTAPGEQKAGGWIHGCVFPTRLNEEELRGWVSQTEALCSPSRTLEFGSQGPGVRGQGSGVSKDSRVEAERQRRDLDP